MAYKDIPEHWKQTESDLEQLCMEGYLLPDMLTMMEHLALLAWTEREMAYKPPTQEDSNGKS